MEENPKTRKERKQREKERKKQQKKEKGKEAVVGLMEDIDGAFEMDDFANEGNGEEEIEIDGEEEPDDFDNNDGVSFQ